MTKAIVLGLSLVLIGTAVAPTAFSGTQSNASINAFWEKFRAAVIKEDKVTVADLTQFPVEMPYGVPKVRNKAQLIKRYRSIFYFEHNARECFNKAKPEVNSSNPSEFTVACKNAAGEEVIIYSFKRTQNGWKFSGLDNINE